MGKKTKGKVRVSTSTSVTTTSTTTKARSKFAKEHGAKIEHSSINKGPLGNVKKSRVKETDLMEQIFHEKQNN